MSNVRLRFTKAIEQIDIIQILRLDGSELEIEALRDDGTVSRFLSRYAVEAVLNLHGVLNAIGKGYDPLREELSSEMWQIEVLVRAIEQEDSFEEVSLRRVLSTASLLSNTVEVSPREFRRMDVEKAIHLATDLKIHWSGLSSGNSFELILKEK